VKPRALVVDDDAGVRFTLRDVLEASGLEVDEAADGAAGLARLARDRFDLVITDLRMPELDGLELLRRVGQGPSAPRVIVITAHGSERHAVEAMKAGAYDYFRKPFEIDQLMGVVRRAIEAVSLRLENDRLAGQLHLSRTMVFRSEAMSRVALLVQRMGSKDVTVLVTGETGTGKERAAEALVRASPRATRPFVRFNCAELPAELAEAELFGHTRGAFTGAQRERLGLFREADGGTILLDEVAELPAGLQAKLLRVLQEGEIRPIGEDRPRKLDVRVLASTHRDLGERVSRGAFREDLFYRLKVVELHLPPLRERREDIPLLATHFFEKYAARYGLPPPHVDADVTAWLSEQPWPGNVRELENMVHGLVVMSSGPTIDASLLPAADRMREREGTDAPALGEPAGRGLKDRVEAYERQIILEALRRAGGNQAEAARALRVGRATLHDKLRKYDLLGS
jgi:two-component system response regulator HydG